MNRTSPYTVNQNKTIPIYNKNQKKQKRSRTGIENSGNSNVDVKLEIDTSPLAYAMGCYLHSTKQLSDEEFVHMINNLRKLLKKENNQIPEFVSNYLIPQKIKSD